MHHLLKVLCHGLFYHTKKTVPADAEASAERSNLHTNLSDTWITGEFLSAQQVHAAIPDPYGLQGQTPHLP
ncbi:hypothetical protein C170_01444 [Paenibacillus sp. FSL H7-689]|nr:hypothetical protein C170_01444 [Paenibacillus sp. FSL H7-689]